MAALAVLFASCQKEGVRTLTATFEQFDNGSKAYIDDEYYACWEHDDAVAINGTTASVTLQRKISVIRLGISGAYPYEYGIYGRYIQKLGIAARSSGGDAKLFASSGTIAATTASWTGVIVPSAYYGINRNTITQLSKEGTFYYYIPVLVDGSLEAGDILSVCFTDKEYSGTTWYDPYDQTKEKTIESTLDFSPGYVYEINADL